MTLSGCFWWSEQRPPCALQPICTQDPPKVCSTGGPQINWRAEIETIRSLLPGELESFARTRTKRTHTRNFGSLSCLRVGTSPCNSGRDSGQTLRHRRQLHYGGVLSLLSPKHAIQLPDRAKSERQSVAPAYKHETRPAESWPSTFVRARLCHADGGLDSRCMSALSPSTLMSYWIESNQQL